MCLICKFVLVLKQKAHLAGDTLLVNLQKEGLLSKRAYNICVGLYLTTLDDLSRCEIDLIARARNSGMKTITELERLRETYKSMQMDDEDFVIFRGIIEDMLPKYYATNRSLSSIVEKIGGVDDVVRLLTSDINSFGHTIDGLNMIQAKNICRLFLKIINDVQGNLFLPEKVRTRLIMIEGPLSEIYHNGGMSLRSQQRVDILRDQDADFSKYIKNSTEIDISHFPDLVVNSFRRRYAEKFNALNTRVKNRFFIYADFDKALSLMYSNVIVNSVGGLSADSVAAFREMLKNYREEFDIVLEELGDASLYKIKGKQNNLPVTSVESIRRIMLIELHSEFPFLHKETCEKILEINGFCDNLPYLFILKKFIERDSKPQARIQADYFGVGRERRSLMEISRDFDLSVERLRQMRVAPLAVPEKFALYVSKQLDKYKNIVISRDSESVEKLMKDNMNLMTPHDILCVLGCLYGDYKLLQFEDSEREYLVSGDVYRAFNFGLTLKHVSNLVIMRRKTDEDVDLRDVLMSYKRDIVSEPNWSISDYQNLYEVLASSIDGLEEVEYDGNGIIHIRANHFDRMKELENIIRERGSEMTINELFDEYNNRFPSDVIKSFNSLRSYLLRCPNISSKGRRGLYVLKEWDWEYTGTYTQCVIEYLREKGHPVDINVIAEVVGNIVAPTTRNRIYTLCTIDKKKRFVYYPSDGTLGLSEWKKE